MRGMTEGEIHEGGDKEEIEGCKWKARLRKDGIKKGKDKR